jgi:hypothetical protein
MKRVTGGNVPAGIWHDFMLQALPRLQSAAIPGSDIPLPATPFGQDPIGDVLTGAVPLNRPPEPSFTTPAAAPADANTPPY